jgi:predicted ATPase
MIRKVTVRGFKSLDELDLELGRVNVFIGANGSGKSNLLEAIGVLGAAAAGRVDDEALARRGVRPGVPALYKSSFRGSKGRREIRLEAESEEGSGYGVSLLNPLDSPLPAWKYKAENLVEGEEKVVGRSPRSKERLNPEAGLAALKIVEMDPESASARLLDALRDYAIYTPNTPALRGLVPDPQQREPLGLSGGRLAEAVGELLKQARKEDHAAAVVEETMELIDWAASVKPAPVSEVPLSPSVPSGRTVLRFRDRFMAEGRDVLTGYDASEGALYVLLTAVLCGHELAPRVLAIDHVDHALNPRLAHRLIERVCRWTVGNGVERQLLLTTHNPLVLDGLTLEDDRVRLFTVDRSSSGRTVVERVEATERLLEMADRGWTLSRLWVMGHLGGVPNV